MLISIPSVYYIKLCYINSHDIEVGNNELEKWITLSNEN